MIELNKEDEENDENEKKTNHHVYSSIKLILECFILFFGYDDIFATKDEAMPVIIKINQRNEKKEKQSQKKNNDIQNLFQFFQSCFEGMKDINLICLLFNVLHGISHRYTKRYHEMNELISEKAGEFFAYLQKSQIRLYHNSLKLLHWKSS